MNQKKKLDSRDNTPKEKEREDEQSTLGGGSIRGWIGPMSTGRNYKELTDRNAKFFGGASLANPDAPASLMKQAQKFASGTADGFGVSSRKKKRNKKNKRNKN